MSTKTTTSINEISIEKLTQILEKLTDIESIGLDIARLMKRAIEPDNSIPSGQKPEKDTFIVTNEEIDAGYWMSRKEAWDHLGVVKSTLEGMILTGELPTYCKRGDENKKKPRVWLKRSDMERMYKTYTLRKGKEKK